MRERTARVHFAEMAENKLPETAEHLRKWISQSQAVADALPRAQQQLAIIEWAQKALEQRPAGAEVVSTDKLYRQCEATYKATIQSWPQFPETPKPTPY